MRKLKANVRPPRPVYIRWLDSTSWPGWRQLDEVPAETLECVTIGHLLHQTDTEVSVAASVALDDDGAPVAANDLIVIPRVAIVELSEFTFNDQEPQP